MELSDKASAHTASLPACLWVDCVLVSPWEDLSLLRARAFEAFSAYFLYLWISNQYFCFFHLQPISRLPPPPTKGLIQPWLALNTL